MDPTATPAPTLPPRRPWAAAALLAVLVGGLGEACRPSPVRSSPEEILSSVRIPDPSVLGYVRAEASGVHSLVRSLNGATDLLAIPGLTIIADSLPVDMVMKAAPLAADGSHMILVLLDPDVFGGGAALHFVPRQSASLVALLDADPHYERLSGAPPEFRLVHDDEAALNVRGFLLSLGVDLALPDRGEYANHFIVEEGSDGILILPSYDARHDVRAFLESTGYLRPWLEAGLVVDLDIGRLARAYAEVIRSVDRSIRGIAAGLDAAYNKQHDTRIVMTPGKRLRFGSVTLLGLLAGTEAGRYVSRLPGNGAAELRILAGEEKGLSRLFETLESDGPAVVGFMPGSAAVQFCLNPGAGTALIADARAFYEQALELDPGSLDPLAKSCGQFLRLTKGRHLVSAGGLGADFWWASCSALGEDAEDPAVHAATRKIWLELGRLFGYGTGGADVEAPGSAWSYEVFSGDGAVDSFQADGFLLAVLRASPGEMPDGKPAAVSAKLFRLMRSLGFAGGRPAGGEDAELFLKLSVAPAAGGMAPVLAGLMKTAVVGTGRIAEQELVVQLSAR